MSQVIIARYGEVHLKGKNRGLFLRALTNNLKHAVGANVDVSLSDNRYIFTGSVDPQKIANTFGIVSVSPCTVTPHAKILDHIKTIKIDGTFKVNVNRADKSFKMSSMEFSAECGAIMLDNTKNATVDVKNPAIIVNIDIRDHDKAFIYHQIINGVGGMPVGTAGRAIVLLSGGIDSPVSAFLASKRGLSVEFLHFASPPYTSPFALDKVSRLVKALAPYCGNTKLHVVPFTEIQDAIKEKCSDSYMITIMRRFMIRIAKEMGADCIITGENLAQVASQTIQGITTNNACAGDVPILRPLVTYDKSEIVSIARRIGTYDISIEPHADCCTVFVPTSPVIAPTIKRCEIEEKKLDVDMLVKNAINGIYIL